MTSGAEGVKQIVAAVELQLWQTAGGHPAGVDLSLSSLASCDSLRSPKRNCCALVRRPSIACCKPERRKQQLRRRSHTKPGTLLKHQIPIRTFAEWDEQQPGFAEIDLVAHDGGLALGDYCQTLDLTDVCTGWTETEAVPNKAQVWVFEAIQKIRERLPFPLRGLDSDNGSEFVNTELLRYCKQQRITFTRSSTLPQK